MFPPPRNASKYAAASSRTHSFSTCGTADNGTEEQAGGGVGRLSWPRICEDASSDNQSIINQRNGKPRELRIEQNGRKGHLTFGKHIRLFTRRPGNTGACSRTSTSAHAEPVCQLGTPKSLQGLIKTFVKKGFDSEASWAEPRGVRASRRLPFSIRVRSGDERTWGGFSKGGSIASGEA